MNFSLIQKEKTKERIFEAIFEYAGSCHVENISEQMGKNELDDEINFPSELDDRMRDIINSYSKKVKRNRTLKIFRRSLPKVAVFLVILLSALTIFTMSVEAIRIRLLNFITDETRQYTDIEVKEEQGGLESNIAVIPPNWEGLYAPTYIPEGFMLDEVNSYLNINVIVYLNDIGQTIMFEQRPNEEANLRADAESANMDRIMVNNFKALLIKKGREIAVVWNNDEFSFTLKGQIDEIELIKIAESVKMVE